MREAGDAGLWLRASVALRETRSGVKVIVVASLHYLAQAYLILRRAEGNVGYWLGYIFPACAICALVVWLISRRSDAPWSWLKVFFVYALVAWMLTWMMHLGEEGTA